jgi:very-short-patch-repair endonuclease
LVLERTTGPALTRSEAERLLLRLVRAAGLPPPEHNVRVGGHEPDLLWREHRLVVEVDGYTYHSGRAAFERDRVRDAELLASGFRVLRLTWRRLVEEPESVVARLAQALAGVS